MLRVLIGFMVMMLLAVVGPPVRAEEGQPNRIEEGTALLRVCIAEAGFENAEDCVGIWHVAKNFMTQHQTDFMTSLKRLHPMFRQPRRALNQRLRWISTIDLSCEKPAGLHISEDIWRDRFREKCLQIAIVSGELVAGKVYDPRYEDAITWGGRCEDPAGACDDQTGCARGLGRLNTKTANAFWSRRGNRSVCRR
jgi:hypothetical protein